jgi:20S proteasome subunit beta 1
MCISYVLNMLPAQINYNNKDNLVGAMIVAGWDKHKGGQLFGVPIGGTLAKEKWTIDGSGSTYIWAYCDSEFK